MVKYILHIIPGFGGGVASLVLNLAEEIINQNVIFDILTYEQPPIYFAERVSKYGGRIFVVNDKSRIAKLKKINVIFKENNQKYELIHMHQSGIQALSLSLLAKFNSISRTAIHSHITDKEGSSALKFKLRHYFEKIVNNSCSTHRLSCSKMASVYLYGQKPVVRHKIMHIPNAIIWENICRKYDKFEIGQYKKSLKIPENALVVGHLGYFGYQKNHEFMLDIIDEMKNQGICFVWLFAGVGTNQAKIIKIAQERHLEDNIRFLGRVNNVSLLYKAMDVMALPSHFEGLPTVVIEAQAAGVPSVISDKVTTEADMGLDITCYISIDNAKNWVKALVEMAQVIIPSEIERFSIMSSRKFVVEESAKLYRKFVEREIETYDLDEFDKL